MNNTVKITGGIPLKGTVKPIPNKNFLVNALPAALLTDKDVTFHNVPDTLDVHKILSMLEDLGASVTQEKSSVTINCKNVDSYKTDSELGGKFRGSILFAGPLLARFGIAEVCVPGGCTLGMRSISAHINVFEKCGIKTEYVDGYVRFTAPKKNKDHYDIWALEASVTATANFSLYAAGVDSEFNLTGAAMEPHIQDVLLLLEQMGADIKGIGSNKITIRGKPNLNEAEFSANPDFVDISGYIVAAAITDGNIRIEGANQPYIIDGIVEWLEKFNINVKRDKNDLVVSRKGDLKIDLLNSGFPLAAPDMPKIYPRPWPGFPVDVLPIIPVLASKTKGKILIQNWMYETGLDFVQILTSLGANIFRSDPQKIIVYGPTEFTGGSVESPSIIQAGKALFLAALCDPVETTISNVDVLRRRYPDIFEVYSTLGAKIEMQ